MDALNEGWLAIGVPMRVRRPSERLSGAVPEGISDWLQQGSEDVSGMGIVFSRRLRLRLRN